jgi:fluoride exporter
MVIVESRVALPPSGRSIVLYKLMFLALAGAAGTLARYGLGGLVQRVAGGAFPWGTLAINVSGCFLFGLVWALAEERSLISPEVRIIILIGFMGAFTTFSTFAYETGAMLQDGEYLIAFGNLAAQNVLGLAGIFLGFIVGRAV